MRYAMAAVMGLSLVGPALAQEPRNDWTVSLGFREANEYDYRLNDVPVEDRILDNANASLAFSTRTERSRFSLFGRLGSDFYRKGSERDRLNYGGGFSWNRQNSPRFNMSLSQNVNRGFMLSTLSSIGTLAPNVDTFSANTSWGMQYQTSPRTTLATSVNYSYIEWKAAEAIAGSQIVLEESPFAAEFPDPSVVPDPGADLIVPDAENAALDIIATEGLNAGDSKTHWATATFGLQTRVSERTSLGFDVSGAYRTIDYTTIPSLEGSEGAFRFWTQRAVGLTTNLQATYQVRRSLVLQPTTTVQSASGGFSYSPRQSELTLRVQGGASYYQAETSKSQLTPTADVAFSAALTRSTRFGISYRRQFTSSLGFGRTLLIDYGNVSLTQGFGSRVDLTALAGGSLGKDPLEEDSRYDAFRYGGTLSVRPLEPLSIGTSFFVAETRQASRGFDNDTRRNLWSFFITYSTSWH
jgi:hypothetical protein